MQEKSYVNVNNNPDADGIDIKTICPPTPSEGGQNKPITQNGRFGMIKLITQHGFFGISYFILKRDNGKWNEIMCHTVQTIQLQGRRHELKPDINSFPTSQSCCHLYVLRKPILQTIWTQIRRS